MNRFMKIAAVLLTLALCLALTGCKDKEKEKITIFNWYDYMDESVLADFTKETGIEVEVAYFTTNEEMYTKFAASPGDYDVLFPSDYMIEKLVNEKLICEIDTSKLTNYAGLLDWIKTPGYDPTGKYSVAYMWGTVGILYNTTMVGETVDSWSVLFDEKYAGNIIMMNSVRDTLGVALSYLGYPMSSTDQAQLEAARDLLISQKQSGLVKAYYVDETKDLMANGEAAIAVMWSGDALYAMEKNEDLAYCVPKEGSNIWIDGMCVSASSEHKDAAQKFIDYMCRPEIAFKNQQYIYYSTPVATVVDMYTDEERAILALNPDQAIIDRCEYFVDISAYNDLYESVWLEVKQAR